MQFMWYLSIRYVERGRGGQGRQDKGKRGREGVEEKQEGYEKKKENPSTEAGILAKQVSRT